MATVFILSLLSFFQYEVEIDAKIIRVSGRKVQLEKFCSQEAKNFVEHCTRYFVMISILARYSLSLHVSKQKMVRKSIICWQVDFE